MRHLLLGIFFAASIAMVGCVGTSSKLNRVAIGMTKPQVIQAIGQPDSVSAKNGMEYLIYHWASPKQLIADESNLDRYFVRLVDGKVESYGEKGDFDSTKPDEINFNVNLNSTSRDKQTGP